MHFLQRLKRASYADLAIITPTVKMRHSHTLGFQERITHLMTRALIIGGGIAGPTTAMALQRVGLDAVLYEAHPRTTDEVGSYFTLTPNGLDALRAIGALHTATAIGFPTHKNALWNDRGRRLGTIPLGEPLPDGTVSHTSHHRPIG